MALFRKKSPDVLVVGAGPVGLLAALSLARRGVNVRIVDSEWRVAAHSYALALHPASLALLDELGLASEVLGRALRVDRIGLWDDTSRRASLEVRALPRELSFVAVMPQDSLETVLITALAAEGVEVEWNHRVSRLELADAGADVTIDRLEKQTGGYAVQHTESMVARRREMTVPYVIGADGHRSFVRGALGIEMEEMAPSERFAVFEFETPADLGGELRIAFAGGGLNVCWPLPGGACRWGFQLVDSSHVHVGREKQRVDFQLGGGSYPMLEESVLKALLQERAPWFDAPVGPIGWRVTVRFENRLATSFGRGPVHLVGDAAHTAGPIGVQSMNVGLAEATELAAIVADALAGRAGSDAFDAWSARGRQAWGALLRAEPSLSAPGDADPWIVSRAAILRRCLPVSGEDFASLVDQIGLVAV